MPPVNAPQQGPQFAPVQPAAARPEAVRAQNAQGQRIMDVVGHAELLPYQQMRATRTPAQQGLYVFGRVVGAILTLGVSEGIIAIGHSAERRNAETLRLQALQRRTLAVQFNDRLGQDIAQGKPLPDSLKSGLGEALGRLREAYGDLVPANLQRLTQMPKGFQLSSAVSDALKQLPEAATAADIARIVTEKAQPFLRQKAVENALGAALARAGVSINPELVITALHRQRPAIREAAEGCTSRAALDAVLEGFQADFQRFADLYKVKADSKAAVLERAEILLAENFGLTREQVRKGTNFSKLESSLGDLLTSINLDDAPAAEEITRLCMEKVEAFVQKKTELLYSADTLDISPELKAQWKTEVLSDKTLSSAGIFREAVAVARDIPVDALAALVRQGSADLSAEMFFARLQSASILLEEALVRHYGLQGWDELGGDGQGLARDYTAQALIDRVPGLSDFLRSHDALRKDVNGIAGREIQETLNAPLHAGPGDDPNVLKRLAATGVMSMLRPFDPAAAHPSGLPLPYQQAANAMELEVRDAFAGIELPENLLDAQLPDSRKVGSALAGLVRNAAAPLSVENFAELARGLMTRAAVEITARALITERFDFVDPAGTKAPTREENVKAALHALLARQPELSEAFSSADSTQSVKRALAGAGDTLESIVARLNGMTTAWVKGEQYLYRRLSEATGLPEADLRKDFSTLGFLRGGTFHYKRQEYIDILNAPNKPIQSIPSSENLVAIYEGMAEKHVSRKGALYQSVDGLPGLSDAFRAQLKKEVITKSTLKLPSFFERCSVTAQGMDAAPLLDALDRRLDSQALIAAVRTLAGQYRNASLVAFKEGEALKDMGPDEKSDIQYFSLSIFFDQNPALKGRLSGDSVAALRKLAEDEMYSIQQRLLSTPESSPTYAELIQQYQEWNTAIAIIITLKTE